MRVAWQALWSSRLVVFLSGVLAVLSFGKAPSWEAFDPMRLTAPFGYFGNLLVAPFARWDSVWYLAIAHGGYDHEAARTAFFPLYPLVLRGLGFVIGSDLVAGVLVSLAAFGVALVLLYRLVELELGGEVARVTVLLIAFCPMAYFFSAVYSESLFLALSLGCIWQARMGRWAGAGVLGALAAAERNTGVTLLVPVVLLFLYGPTRRSRAGRPARWPARALRALLPRYRPTPALAWALLVPVGLGAYVLALALATGHGLAPFHAQQVWFRHFAGPFGGVWDGAVAAWDGLRQLVHGPAPPVYFSQAGGDPLMVAGQNLMLFGFLVLGAVALVGAFRRLPFAYGAYCLVALALPLSYPVTPQPLMSLPRYEVVLFPLFMWGAWWVVPPPRDDARARVAGGAARPVHGGVRHLAVRGLGVISASRSCSTRSGRWSSSSRPRRRCVRSCRAGSALALSEADCERAIAAEIAYYRAHLDEGRDARRARRASAPLRRRLREALPLAARDAAADLDALIGRVARVAAVPRVTRTPRPRCRGGAGAGCGWWSSATGTSRCTRCSSGSGSASLLDGVLTSAEAGARKPAPAIFERALALAGRRRRGGDPRRRQRRGGRRRRPGRRDRAGAAAPRPRPAGRAGGPDDREPGGAVCREAAGRLGAPAAAAADPAGVRDRPADGPDRGRGQEHGGPRADHEPEDVGERERRRGPRRPARPPCGGRRA